MTSSVISLVRQQRGFLLVETLVSLMIIGILSMLVFELVTVSGNTATQGMVRTAQQNESDLVLDFLKSNLNSVSVGEVGLTANSGTTINPTSIAGDQVVFWHGSRCVRLYYVARDKDLMAAVSTNGCADIAPARGPNEYVSGYGYYVNDPTSPVYDPVLDNPSNLPATCSVYSLTDGVLLTADGSTDTGSFPLLTVLDDSQTQLGTDNQAASDSASSFYADAANLQSIAWLKTNGYVAGNSAVGIGINAREITQQYALNY